MQRSQNEPVGNSIKFYLKATVLILIAFAAAGCPKNLQQTSSHRPYPEARSVALSPNHLEETPAHVAEDDKNQLCLEQTPAAGQVGNDIANDARQAKDDGSKADRKAQKIDRKSVV